MMYLFNREQLKNIRKEAPKEVVYKCLKECSSLIANFGRGGLIEKMNCQRGWGNLPPDIGGNLC